MLNRLRGYRLRGYKEIRGNFSSGFTVARAAIPIPIRLQSCAMNSTERAKDMAATNGFDQAQTNKENGRHSSVWGIGRLGLNWCLGVKYLPAIAVFVLMVSTGMSLDRSEFIANWRRLTSAMWARLLLVTFIVPPALALALAQVLPVGLAAMVGLFLIAAAPPARR